MLVVLLGVAALILATVLALRAKEVTKEPPQTSTEKTGLDRNKPKFQFENVSITPLRCLDVANTEPFPYRPWSSGKFVMTMGIKKVPQDEWLGLDNRYWAEQELRRNLLESQHDGVTQVLSGSEAACIEALDTIISYLTRRFPDLFFHPDGNADHIHNKLTGRTFRIHAPYEIPPLEVAAQLVMEDINLMIQGFGPNPEEHYLAASYTMGPAGWYLQDRIGWPLWKIHTTVPLWEEKLRRSVEKAFMRMRPEDLICRHNFFVQSSDVLFQQEPFADELVNGSVRIEDVRIRHERQTLRRLPKTNAILFTVRTYLKPILELADEPESIREFLGAVRAMHPDMARYKGREIWGATVEAWCEKKLAEAGLSLEISKD